MNLLFIFLTLLVSFSAAFSPRGLEPPGKALSTATAFQAAFDKNIKYKSHKNFANMISDSFRYEGCSGMQVNKEGFTAYAMGNQNPAKVLEARADKNHIIYKMQYKNELHEAMITQTGKDWKLTRAQGLHC